MVISFPTRLKYSKVNPLEDFYLKSIKAAAIDMELINIKVWAFSVNPKDYSKLKQKLKKHIKIQHPKTTYRALKITLGMTLLDIGPRVSNKVSPGSVEIDVEELLRDDKNKTNSD